MAYSQMMHVKVRVNNMIHDITIPHYLIEDINTRGIRSSVITSLDPQTATSTVIGNFMHPVDIMLTEPVNNAVADQEEAQVQVMDVQVSMFKLFSPFM